PGSYLQKNRVSLYNAKKIAYLILTRWLAILKLKPCRYLLYIDIIYESDFLYRLMQHFPISSGSPEGNPPIRFSLSHESITSPDRLLEAQNPSNPAQRRRATPSKFSTFPTISEYITQRTRLGLSTAYHSHPAQATLIGDPVSTNHDRRLYATLSSISEATLLGDIQAEKRGPLRRLPVPRIPAKCSVPDELFFKDWKDYLMENEWPTGKGRRINIDGLRRLGRGRAVHDAFDRLAGHYLNPSALFNDTLPDSVPSLDFSRIPLVDVSRALPLWLFQAWRRYQRDGHHSKIKTNTEASVLQFDVAPTASMLQRTAGYLKECGISILSLNVHGLAVRLIHHCRLPDLIQPLVTKLLSLTEKALFPDGKDDSDGLLDFQGKTKLKAKSHRIMDSGFIRLAEIIGSGFAGFPLHVVASASILVVCRLVWPIFSFHPPAISTPTSSTSLEGMARDVNFLSLLECAQHFQNVTKNKMKRIAMHETQGRYKRRKKRVKDPHDATKSSVEEHVEEKRKQNPKEMEEIETTTLSLPLHPNASSQIVSFKALPSLSNEVSTVMPQFRFDTASYSWQVSLPANGKDKIFKVDAAAAGFRRSGLIALEKAWTLDSQIASEWKKKGYSEQGPFQWNSIEEFSRFSKRMSLMFSAKLRKHFRLKFPESPIFNKRVCNFVKADDFAIKCSLNLKRKWSGSIPSALTYPSFSSSSHSTHTLHEKNSSCVNAPIQKRMDAFACTLPSCQQIFDRLIQSMEDPLWLDGSVEKQLSGEQWNKFSESTRIKLVETCKKVLINRPTAHEAPFLSLAKEMETIFSEKCTNSVLTDSKHEKGSIPTILKVHSKVSQTFWNIFPYDPLPWRYAEPPPSLTPVETIQTEEMESSTETFLSQGNHPLNPRFQHLNEESPFYSLGERLVPVVDSQEDFLRVLYETYVHSVTECFQEPDRFTVPYVILLTKMASFLSLSQKSLHACVHLMERWLKSKVEEETPPLPSTEGDT
ncbi:hypothetical protein IE077_003171, partial [Cardiosporidium cionae]